MPKLMEILEFFDNKGDTMVTRVPPDDQAEIKWGAQLTVRESQTVIFFRDGKAQIVFKSGRHVLKTQNIPVLTRLVTSFGYGPDSPFRAEVYFLNMKLFRNLKWGTKDPILFRDPEFQIVRLRLNGIFSIQIKDPSLFLNRMVGTQNIFHDTDIHDYLRSILASRLINVLGDQVKSILDLPKYYDTLAGMIKAIVADDFKSCGLELVDFFINTISLPDDVQKIVDERTGMQAIGDMEKYMKFKVAKSIEEAAKQPGGIAGAGVGLGAGVGMGMTLPGMIKQSFEGEQKGKRDDQNGDPGIFEKIKKLKELLDMEAITQEEFDKKKSDWFNKF